MKKNGWLFLAVVPVLAMFGCNAPGGPIDFGLSMRYESDAGDKGEWCMFSEGTMDGISGSIDRNPAFPNLRVDFDADRENDTYTLRIVETFKPNSDEASEKVLVKRTYDQTFGDNSHVEEIHVNSAGVGYDFDIKGLPRDVKECPLANVPLDDN
jgi:hypothetical protein